MNKGFSKNDGGGEIATLLSNLPRVEAPGDFETRVKSRILNSQPESRSGRFAFLKLALPAGALAGLALFLLLSGFLSRDIEPIQVAEEKKNAPVIVPVPSENNGEPAGIASVTDPDERIARNEEVASTDKDTSHPSGNLNTVRRSTKADGGSIDLGANLPERPVLPRGFDPDQKQHSNQGVRSAVKVPVANVLSFVGLNAEFRQGGWYVNSVVDQSPAQRIGIRAGDMIEAFNELRLDRSTAFTGGIELKTVRVRRGGEVVNLRF